MLEAGRHLAELGRFAATRRRQERRDLEVLAELERRPLDLPPGLEIEWLGVAGYRLTFEGQTLLIDPYVSRVPWRSLVRREPALPDRAMLDRFLRPPGTVVGVLVGHTHFDHAVDAPAAARRFDCKAFGSRSLAHLMALHGLGERAVEVDPGSTRALGPFRVTFVPSRHAKILLGLRVPFDGELSCASLDALTPSAYRLGQVWAFLIEVAGVTLYHQGSADLIDDAVPEGGVDVFLAGVAGREFTRDYWKRILPRLEPRVIVPCHHDDFFRPLTAPMGLLANVNLSRLPEEIEGVGHEVALAALPRVPGGG